MKNLKNLILILLLVLYSCSSENISYEISNAGLKVNATVHGIFIPKDSLIIESIKVIDFNSDYSYKPYFRLWGISQPEFKTKNIKIDKYNEGWFLLNNDEIALVFLSQHSKAVYIRTKLKPPSQVRLISKIEPTDSSGIRENFSVLLGSDKPDELKKLLEAKWLNDNENRIITL